MMTHTLTPNGAIKNAEYGWDGTVWRKLPMIWGYSDVHHNIVTDLNLPAGSQNIDGAVVPAGEVWVITSIVAYVGSASCTEYRLIVGGGALTPIFAVKKPIVSTQYDTYSCHVVLKAGNFIRLRMYGLTLNDDGDLHIIGYKMKVAE